MTTLVLPDRVRLRYEKLGKVRFTSQRDLARVVERAMRRANLPLRQSSGFSPRPLLSFGLALPTGCASRAEYLDVRLDEAIASSTVTVVAAGDELPASLHALCELLSALLPQGIDVRGAAAIEGSMLSLQEAVTSCNWELEVLGVSPAEMAERVGRVLDADAVTIARDRKGRTVTDDIRPSILSLRASTTPVRVIEGLGEVVGLDAELSTRTRGVRPAELCQVLGEDVTLLGACRTHQWIESEDRTVREEPLSPAGILAAGRPVGTEVRDG